MTITTIISDAMPVSSQRNGRTAGERRGAMDTDAANQDQVSVSGRAQAMYAADQSRKLDVIRERVRRGYYLEGYITEQIVDCVAREIEAALGR